MKGIINKKLRLKTIEFTCQCCGHEVIITSDIDIHIPPDRQKLCDECRGLNKIKK